MVAYIGTARVQELVARIGAADFIEALAGEIEADYRRWSEFDKSPRHAVHSPGGVIELMPTSDGRLYSFKYVNGHPKNTASGLLTVTAFGVLADVATGYPLLLSEMTFVTALRTAAISALAGRLMARPDSRVMAVIGNGAQSEFQVLAFHRMAGIREVRLFDTDPQATAKLMRNLAALRIADLDVIRCKSAADAVRGADIVTTATADKCNALILTPEMIEPGMHLNAVGGDCPGKTELHVDILRRPDARIVVEFEPQARIEGEIQQLDASEPVAELADVLAAKRAARATQRDVTIFDSVGFALNDFSALRYLHRLNSEQRERSSDIDLVPVLADPKDLFGGLVGISAVSRRSAPLRAVDRSFA
jgi:ornithine cyclodeaminase